MDNISSLDPNHYYERYIMTMPFMNLFYESFFELVDGRSASPKRYRRMQYLDSHQNVVSRPFLETHEECAEQERE